MADTTVFFTGGAGAGDDGVYVWTWTIAIEGEDGAEYIEHSQFYDARLPGVAHDVKIGGFGYNGYQSFDVLLSSVDYEHAGGQYKAGAHFLEIAENSTLTQTTSTFHVAGGLHIDGTMTIQGLYAYHNFLLLGTGVEDFSLTGDGELRLDLGYITGFEGSITDFHNYGHIAGYGIIGTNSGWAAYPSNGGWLAIHNEAYGVIEADVPGQELTLRPETSAFNPIDNAASCAQATAAR